MTKTWLSCALLAWAWSALASPAAKPPEANLAPNPGFEEPAGIENAYPTNWTHYTSTPKMNNIGVSSASKLTGNQCLRIKTQGVTNASHGLLAALPVTPGDKYTFIVNFLNDKADPLGGTFKGSLAIEWKNAQGKEIGRSRSTDLDTRLSRMHWTDVSIKKAPAPKGAVQGVFGIHLEEGSEGAQGSLLVDDVVIER